MAPQKAKVQEVAQQPQIIERIVREVVEKPIVIEKLVEKPYYVMQEVTRPIMYCGVPVSYRRIEVPPDFLDTDFPYHDPLPERGCNFVGHLTSATSLDPWFQQGDPMHAG
jgi:hypothetical protein